MLTPTASSCAAPSTATKRASSTSPGRRSDGRATNGMRRCSGGSTTTTPSDRRHAGSPSWRAASSPCVCSCGGSSSGPTARSLGAVRAVDTATHPDLQGRGLFRRLTLLAVDELTADGTRFVFNTPNDQSRPGYLKMGWQSLGRAPVIVAPRRGRSLARLVRARAPAERWSAPCEAGRPAIDALADPHMASLLTVQDVDRRRTHTARTAAYMSWRYTQGPIEYRALETGDPDQGLVVFRLRRPRPGTRGGHRRVARSARRPSHSGPAGQERPQVDSCRLRPARDARLAPRRDRAGGSGSADRPDRHLARPSPSEPRRRSTGGSSASATSSCSDRRRRRHRRRPEDRHDRHRRHGEVQPRLVSEARGAGSDHRAAGSHGQRDHGWW